MKKKALSIILATLCVVACAFSACGKTEQNENSTSVGGYNDPVMDDIYG